MLLAAGDVELAIEGLEELLESCSKDEGMGRARVVAQPTWSAGYSVQQMRKATYQCPLFTASEPPNSPLQQ